MKKQPQKPEPLFGYEFIDRGTTTGAIQRQRASNNWKELLYRNHRCDNYISHLESENTALKKRVAELEKGQEIITQWCRLSIEHMKQYEGDQSEYDGMYQAASDLLDRINGTMPWPDLVMERLSKVK